MFERERVGVPNETCERANDLLKWCTLEVSAQALGRSSKVERSRCVQQEFYVSIISSLHSRSTGVL